MLVFARIEIQSIICMALTFNVFKLIRNANANANSVPLRINICQLKNSVGIVNMICALKLFLLTVTLFVGLSQSFNDSNNSNNTENNRKGRLLGISGYLTGICVHIESY